MEYKLLLKQAIELIENEDYFISLLANTSAFLNEYISDLNWVGYYLYKDNNLILGPFNGKVACNKISLGKGVCGSAVAKNEVLVVDNVHEFEGHIACDANSNSEIVLPIIKDGIIIGCLDIDSPNFARFDTDLKDFLVKFIEVLILRLGKIKY